MKRKTAPPQHCRGCRFNWPHSLKNWCCYYGKAAAEIVSHCKNDGGKQMIVVEDNEDEN